MLSSPTRDWWEASSTAEAYELKVRTTPYSTTDRVKQNFNLARLRSPSCLLK